MKESLNRRSIDSMLKKAGGQFNNVLIFFTALVAAFATSFIVRLKSANPYNISNVENALTGWSPESNYFRVLYIIVATGAIFLALQYVRARFGQKPFRLVVAGIATMAIVFGTLVPSYASPAIDMFHNGEQLGPASGFMNGKGLYTDLFFLHGAGEDILVPNIAFDIFNGGQPSIGAYSALNFLLKTATILLLFLLLARLVRHENLFLFAAIWFAGTSFDGFLLIKNIFVYSFVFLCWWLLTRPPTDLRKRLAIAGGAGFVASVTLFYSIDVGVIMTLLSAGIAVLLLCTEKASDSEYRLRWPGKLVANYYPPLAIAAGGIVAQLLSLLILGFQQYKEFITMSFIEIPKYQGLMFDYPLPQPKEDNFLFWLPVILAAIIGYGISQLIYTTFQKRHTIHKDVYFLAALYALSILYLRFAVGRPDTPHMAVSTALLFLSGFYLVQLHLDGLFAKPTRKSLPLPAIWTAALFIILLFWPHDTWNFSRVISAGSTTAKQVRIVTQLPSKPDDQWLNDEQRSVVNYIKKNSTKNDPLFVLTTDPMYYYLTERPNPSRFYITWFADPQPYTNELLQDLKENKPKYVIYSSNSPYQVSDGYNVRDRVPEVDKWVLKNYPKSKTIGETVIRFR